MTENAPRCPNCNAPLAGLGTFCWTCERYTAQGSGGDPSSGRGAGNGSQGHPGEDSGDTRFEWEIRLAIRKALETVGWVVIDFEQGWRKDGSTRVIKGLPDLGIMGGGRWFWVEVKTRKGVQSQDQVRFQALAERAGIPYMVWRHQNQAIHWMKENPLEDINARPETAPE